MINCPHDPFLHLLLDQRVVLEPLDVLHEKLHHVSYALTRFHAVHFLSDHSVYFSPSTSRFQECLHLLISPFRCVTVRMLHDQQG